MQIIHLKKLILQFFNRPIPILFKKKQTFYETKLFSDFLRFAMKQICQKLEENFDLKIILRVCLLISFYFHVQVITILKKAFI